MRRFALVIARVLPAILVAALNGCESERPPNPPAKATPTTQAASQPTAADLASVREFVQDKGARPVSGLPEGHPPINGSAGTLPPMMPASPAAAQSALQYTAPTAWQKEPVKSAMRVDQYRLPRVEGDSEDGELAVFGTSIGGGIEANIQRWRSQFTTPDGQPVPDEAFTRQQLEANGLKITFVDVAGRFSGAMTMGGGAASVKDSYRLLGAIVDTPAGPWYFKATGPAATMTANREAFMELLHSMKAK